MLVLFSVIPNLLMEERARKRMFELSLGQMMSGHSEWFLDSHCHLDTLRTRLTFSTIDELFSHFKGTVPRTFRGCIANFVYPGRWDKDDEWIQTILNDRFIAGASYGCHPNHSAGFAVDELREQLLTGVTNSRYRCVAIGECGVDLARNSKETLKKQLEVFEVQVEVAVQKNLPLIIHCRGGQNGNPEDDVLQVLMKHPMHPIHKHCFLEGPDSARKWLKLRHCAFGFTPGILFCSEEVDEAIRLIPADRMMLETDAPFFKPKALADCYSSKDSHPGLAVAVAFKLAKLKGVSVDEMLRYCRLTTMRTYNLIVDDLARFPAPPLLSPPLHGPLFFAPPFLFPPPLAPPLRRSFSDGPPFRRSSSEAPPLRRSAGHVQSSTNDVTTLQEGTTPPLQPFIGPVLPMFPAQSLRDCSNLAPPFTLQTPSLQHGGQRKNGWSEGPPKVGVGDFRRISSNNMGNPRLAWQSFPRYISQAPSFQDDTSKKAENGQAPILQADANQPPPPLSDTDSFPPLRDNSNRGPPVQRSPNLGSAKRVASLPIGAMIRGSPASPASPLHGGQEGSAAGSSGNDSPNKFRRRGKKGAWSTQLQQQLAERSELHDQ